jgi:hypothetical protein
MCTTAFVYLFYQGQVYSRPTVSGFLDLSKHQCEGNPHRHQREENPPKHKDDWRIWALINGDFQVGPPIDVDSYIWPIQTSYPDREQFHSWNKPYGAAMLGMP